MTDVLPRCLRVVLFACSLPVLAACAAGPVGDGSSTVIAAVIVKTRVPATAEAVTRSAQGALGRDAGVRYVRPIAGDAHILHLTGPATREQVPELVERLRAVAAFQYVELDSTMKIQ